MRLSTISKLLLQTVLFWIIAFQVDAVDLSKHNFRYLYDGTVDIQHQLTLRKDTFELYLSIDHDSNNYNFIYQENYNGKGALSVQPIKLNKDSSGNQPILKVKLKNLTEYNLLIFEFHKKGLKFYYDIRINGWAELGHIDFSMVFQKDSSIFLRNHLPKDEALNTEYDSLVGYSYTRDFSAAKPPMITRPTFGKRDLTLDSIFFIGSTFNPINKDKLIFIQKDSSTNTGRGFITVTDYFPKFRMHEELVQPIVYISTKDEYQKLSKSKITKKAFDSFWIRLLRNKETAKKVIKQFYQNVTRANRLFTYHKAGWKTDPGMIYIVFGPPEEVEKKVDQELWSYNRFGEKVTFAFKIVPNLFVGQHLSLQRSKAHSKPWFRQVSVWRKGNL